MSDKKKILGVDIGNVIINHRNTDKNDKILYEEKYSTIPATEGVIEALKEFNDKKLFENIFLVSKCTEWAQQKILGWLTDNDFYDKTGIKKENLFFCRERHEKESICRKNNITHFVDDRLEVLGYLVGVVPNLFLYQPDPEEVRKYKQFLPEVVRVESWSEAVERIKNRV